MFKTTWLGISILLIFVLAGCQSATLEPVPTGTAIPPTPMAEPTELMATEVVVEEDYCVACHTDKERLISTAKLEEVVEKESSGVG